MTDPRQGLGRRGEALAGRHLESLGYSILVRNHRTRSGEINLVAKDQDTLVFAEVRTSEATPTDHPRSP